MQPGALLEQAQGHTEQMEPNPGNSSAMIPTIARISLMLVRRQSEPMPMYSVTKPAAR